MKTLILLIALLPGVALAAEAQKKQKKPASVTANPCAQYGDGWVLVAGTSTCVKLSGSYQVDIGVSGGTRR